KPEIKLEDKTEAKLTPVEKVSANSSAKNNSLPNTGENASIATVLGLSLLVASGFISMRRRVMK
ncbi:TPA: LPXTG cell wall anchor domain-containing protein, partial [Streptococcus suis]